MESPRLCQAQIFKHNLKEYIGLLDINIWIFLKLEGPASNTLFYETFKKSIKCALKSSSFLPKYQCVKNEKGMRRACNKFWKLYNFSFWKTPLKLWKIRKLFKASNIKWQNFSISISTIWGNLELDKWKVGINNSVQIHLLSLLSICVFAQNRHREGNWAERDKSREHKLTANTSTEFYFDWNLEQGKKEFDLRQTWNIQQKVRITLPNYLAGYF